MYKRAHRFEEQNKTHSDFVNKFPSIPQHIKHESAATFRISTKVNERLPFFSMYSHVESFC